MAPAMGTDEKETAEDSAPADGVAAAQDGGMMLFSAGANSQDAEGSSPAEEPQGAERLVDETTILRSLETVTPARFAASAARDAAPLAAEGEPASPEIQAPPESGVPAGDPDGTASPPEGAAPEAQPKPDPAKELETVLVETGLTHLALNWMPEGFALEKAYTVSGDEPEDVKTGVAMYALAPEGEQKAGESAEDAAQAETADAPKTEAAAAEDGDSPKAPEEKCPPRPSLTVSAKAQTETMVLPAGEEWTVLFHDQKALVKHEIQMDGNTVLRDEFTAVFTRNGYRYEVRGTSMSQEDFFLAVQSIFWTPQA